MARKASDGQRVRRDRLVADFVDDRVAATEERVAVWPRQSLQALDDHVRAVDRAQSLVGHAGVRRHALHMHIHVHPPAIAERERQAGADLDDAERGTLGERGEDRL